MGEKKDNFAVQTFEAIAGTKMTIKPGTKIMILRFRPVARELCDTGHICRNYLNTLLGNMVSYHST